MKARIGPARWLFLTFGVALLAVVLYVRQHGELLRFAEDGELVRLRAERQRLSAFEPAALRATQAKLEELEKRTATDRPWPEGWSGREENPGEDAGGATWRLSPTGVPSWTGLVNAIGTLVSVPGSRIVSVQIRSRGTLTERQMASVEIVLTQPTTPWSRRNPSGGTTGPGAGDPATPTAVGAGPSLRRPSASAEPPAPGQASAPIRPDPRGPRAGTVFIPNPQPTHP